MATGGRRRGKGKSILEANDMFRCERSDMMLKWKDIRNIADMNELCVIRKNLI